MLIPKERRERKKQVVFRLRESQLQRLKALAADSDVTLAWAVEYAVQELLRRADQPHQQPVLPDSPGGRPGPSSVLDGVPAIAEAMGFPSPGSNSDASGDLASAAGPAVDNGVAPAGAK